MAIWPFRAPSGELPAEYAGLREDPATLLVVEGVSMTGRVKHLHSPMRRASGAVSLHAGAVVLTPHRLVIAFGRRGRLDAQFTDDKSAPLHVTFQPAQVAVQMDVATAIQGASGDCELLARAAIPPAVRQQMGAATRHATMNEADAIKLVRYA